MRYRLAHLSKKKSVLVVLVTAVGAFRSRLTPTGLRRVNVASGLIIGAFAVVAVASALT